MRVRTIITLGSLVAVACASALGGCTGAAVNSEANAPDAATQDAAVTHDATATVDGTSQVDSATPEDAAIANDTSVPVDAADASAPIDAADAAHAPDAADAAPPPDAAPLPDAAPPPDSAIPEDAADTSTPEDAADAADAFTGPTYCDLGLARGNPGSGGITVFDGEQASIPSGHYRISYVDGCMTYGGGQSFTVHAYAPSTASPAYATWTLVGADGTFLPSTLPGFWIFGAGATPAGADYDGCVALNQTSIPLEIDYAAGTPLAIQLDDSPLSDNGGGPGGEGPTWRLELYSPTGACPSSLP